MPDLVQYCLAPKGSLTFALETFSAQARCACCGIAGTNASVSDKRICVVCAPALCVDEPDIDTFSTIIWLPHIDQGFLNRLARAAYAARYVSEHAQPDEIARASRAYEMLSELERLRTKAKQIIGTDQVSLLRRVIPSMPQYTLFLRNKRVSGLRILPLGPWFDLHGENFRKLITSRN